jgi:hypothetical protein
VTKVEGLIDVALFLYSDNIILIISLSVCIEKVKKASKEWQLFLAEDKWRLILLCPKLVFAVIFFVFLAKILWTFKFSGGYRLCCSAWYYSSPTSLHSLNLGSYESWQCVLPCSLLGPLLPTLSKVISFYLQYSSCFCILLSSILHTLAQVLFFKGIKKMTYC